MDYYYYYYVYGLFANFVGNNYHYCYQSYKSGTGIVSLVYRLATGWMVRRSNPGGRFFGPIQTGPEAHPSSSRMGTASPSRK
jgi:hypothetical protein